MPRTFSIFMMETMEVPVTGVGGQHEQAVHLERLSSPLCLSRHSTGPHRSVRISFCFGLRIYLLG